MAPNFRREIEEGAFLFFGLLATLCGLLKNVRGPSISLVPDPTKEGAPRALKETVLPFALLMV
jgi:hypothetical protein